MEAGSGMHVVHLWVLRWNVCDLCSQCMYEIGIYGVACIYKNACISAECIHLFKQ